MGSIYLHLGVLPFGVANTFATRIFPRCDLEVERFCQASMAIIGNKWVSQVCVFVFWIRQNESHWLDSWSPSRSTRSRQTGEELLPQEAHQNSILSLTQCRHNADAGPVSAQCLHCVNDWREFCCASELKVRRWLRWSLVFMFSCELHTLCRRCILTTLTQCSRNANAVLPS